MNLYILQDINPVNAVDCERRVKLEEQPRRGGGHVVVPSACHPIAHLRPTGPTCAALGPASCVRRVRRSAGQHGADRDQCCDAAKPCRRAIGILLHELWTVRGHGIGPDATTARLDEAPHVRIGSISLARRTGTRIASGSSSTTAPATSRVAELRPSRYQSAPRTCGCCRLSPHCQACRLRRRRCRRLRHRRAAASTPAKPTPSSRASAWGASPARSRTAAPPARRPRAAWALSST